MKKTLLALGMAVLICGTVFSKTTDPDEISKTNISLVPVENGKFNLNIRTEKMGIAKVRISNDKGNLIMSKRINYSKSFTLPVSLTDLKEGAYKVHVSTGDEEFDQEVFFSHLYKEDVAAFISEPEENIFAVKVFHEDVPVNIRIYDKDGNKLHDETVKTEHNFEKRYNLTQLGEKGGLSIVIKGKKSHIVESL